MLDSIQSKTDVETSSPPKALINDVHDSDPKFWSNLRAGMMAGAEESMQDVKGHVVRDGVTALVGLAAGKFSSVYSTFGSKMPLLLGTAFVATTLSRYYESDGAKIDPNQNISDFDFGKGLGRFLTDVVAATGVGYVAGKQMWRKEGADHAEYLVNRSSDWRYVPAHRSTYGPKMYSFGSHYEHTGLTMKQKTNELREFLKARDEMSKFSELLPRMKEMHNPKLEGRVWTTKTFSMSDYR